MKSHFLLFFTRGHGLSPGDTLCHTIHYERRNKTPNDNECHGIYMQNVTRPPIHQATTAAPCVLSCKALGRLICQPRSSVVGHQSSGSPPIRVYPSPTPEGGKTNRRRTPNAGIPTDFLIFFTRGHGLSLRGHTLSHNT